MEGGTGEYTLIKMLLEKKLLLQTSLSKVNGKSYLNSKSNMNPVNELIITINVSNILT